MLKKYKCSLTLRVFWLTFAFSVLACAITYGAIAGLTPLSYTALLKEELDAQAEALVRALEQGNAEAAPGLLQRFAQEKNAELRLTDRNGNIWFDTFLQENTTAAEAGAYEYAMESGDIYVDAAASEQAEASEGYDAYQGRYALTFADGLEAELDIFSAMKAVNQATEAMRKLLPLLTLAVLALSFLGAVIYSRVITRPMVALSRIARKMAMQDFDARWQGTRNDEIGALGESLNLLSENLSRALAQLREANAALQSDIDRERALERQRTAFFAAASHELKTPVAILKGQIGGMLAQVGVYQDREKYLARALKVTARMESLIREILTISRINAADYILQREPLELSTLLEHSLAQNAELMEQRDMRLEKDIARDARMEGNKNLLMNALDNVLVNAILYSPPGATIRVRLDARCLRIENTRAHIPEDVLTRVFEPFARAEPSRNRASGGSGLGLYLVRCILDLHHIPCRLENTADGVCFTADTGMQALSPTPPASDPAR